MDGGVAAIIGYFYQLLGSSADLLAASDKQFTLLFLEQDGEDAMLRTATSEALIQYKYSGSNDALSPSDLASILETLETHNTIATTTWILSTNRPLSQASLPLMYGGFPNAPGLNVVATKNAEIIQKYNARLEIKQASFTEFEQTIRKHGQRFGLTQDELANGAKRVIGALISLIKEFGAGAKVEMAFLDEQLVGFPKPASLWDPDRANELADRIDQIAVSLDGPKLDELIPREALKDLWITNNPVIVIEGPGGCGKKVSVLKALQSRMQDEKLLGLSLNSSDHGTFMSVVSSWRCGTSPRAVEDFNLSLERLKIANDEIEGPIVLIALDGIDEHGWRSERSEHAQMLLRRALNRNPNERNYSEKLRVIVTCRQRLEVRELISSGVGVGGLNDQLEPHIISLREFDRTEFQTLWAKWFDGLQMPVWCDEDDLRAAAPLTESLEDDRRSSTSTDAHIIQALRNPTLLGCFRRLDPPLRLSFLNGEPESWSVLMDRHLDWFTLKVRSRRAIPDEDTIRMLCAAANVTRDALTAFYNLDESWVRPMVQDVGRPANDARQLFEDAVTCGIIETPDGLFAVPKRGPVRWKWRYEFIPKHLCDLP